MSPVPALFVLAVLLFTGVPLPLISVIGAVFAALFLAHAARGVRHDW